MNTSLVFLTGAAGGIGQATLQQLLAAGHEVWIIVRNDLQAAQCQAALGGQTVRAITADLASKTDVEAASAEMARIALEHEGAVALVTCSGIVNSMPTDCPDWDAFEDTLRVNTIAPLRLSQALIPAMRQRGAGRIIHVSSVEGHMTFPFVGAYSASKHALEAVCAALRLEGHADGIRVTSIVPGFVNTPIWDKAEALELEQFAHSKHYALLRAMRPKFISLGKSGIKPDKVAKAVCNALDRRRAPLRVVLVQIYLVEWVLARMLPLRFRDWIIRKFVGLS